MAKTPYESVPPTGFWRSGVAEMAPEDIRGLWQPKFDIDKRARIITAGSCFAQHIGRALRERGYNWYDAEPAPGSAELQNAYQYGTFSFRTGNIYTARMLNQWLRWAHNPDDCPDLFWEKDGWFFDPFRPGVEMDGFLNLDEARASRRSTLSAIQDAIRKADIFVFTMGLTECWREKENGLEYAICPGTVAGEFDPERHEFHNMNYPEVTREMSRVLATLRKTKPTIRVLLTVSPVPLTATASGQHVLTATSQSKSVLRAAAGALTDANDFVDYFPSYEIITHPGYGGKFYAENQRSVRPIGVDHVMRCFFDDLAAKKSGGRVISKPAPQAPTAKAEEAQSAEEVHCEEAMLDAFRNRAS